MMEFELRFSTGVMFVMFCIGLFIGICGVIDGVREKDTKLLRDSLAIIFVMSAVTALVLGVAK